MGPEANDQSGTPFNEKSTQMPLSSLNEQGIDSNGLPKISPDDKKLLILIGAADSGKTSFIKYCFSDETPPNKTTRLKMYYIKKGFMKNTIIIDTPGFGSNPDLSDYEIMAKIKAFLDDFFKSPERCVLGGFIICQAITDGTEKFSAITQFIQYLLIALEKRVLLSSLILLTKSESLEDEKRMSHLKLLEELVQNKVDYVLWSNIQPLLHQENKLLKQIEGFKPYFSKLSQLADLQIENVALKKVAKLSLTKAEKSQINVEKTYIEKNPEWKKIDYYKVLSVDTLEGNIIRTITLNPCEEYVAKSITIYQCRYVGNSGYAANVSVEYQIFGVRQGSLWYF